MKKKSNTKNKLPPFVPVFIDILDSTAFQTLPPTASKLLIYFFRACSRSSKSPLNTDTIFNFTYAEAEKLGFARRTFSKALQDLKKHKFVSIVETGGLRGAGHSNSQYKLSDGWVAYGGLEWAQKLYKEDQLKKKLKKNQG